MTLYIADTGPVTPAAPPAAPHCGVCRRWRGRSEVFDHDAGGLLLMGKCQIDGAFRLETERCGQFVARG
jgi:hypothetical protein